MRRTPEQIAELMIPDSAIDSVQGERAKKDRLDTRSMLAAAAREAQTGLVPAPSVGEIIDAWDAFGGDDVSEFVGAWDSFIAGTDTPCPNSPSGIHQTSNGSCDLCGDKNRN